MFILNLLLNSLPKVNCNLGRGKQNCQNSILYPQIVFNLWIKSLNKLSCIHRVYFQKLIPHVSHPTSFLMRKYVCGTTFMYASHVLLLARLIYNYDSGSVTIKQDKYLK